LIFDCYRYLVPTGPVKNQTRYHCPRKPSQPVVFPCPVRDKISVERNATRMIPCREVRNVSSLRDDIHYWISGFYQYLVPTGSVIIGHASMSRQGQNIGRKKCKMIVFPCPVRDRISVGRNAKLSCFHVPLGTTYR